MGAKNVSACFAMWSHLDHAPFRLLVGMALIALDDDDSGRATRMFFGGESALVDLLGRSRSAAYRALQKLQDAGAIEVEEEGRNGHRAIYRLLLDPVSSVAVSDTLRKAPKGRAQRHPSGEQGRAHRDPEGSHSADRKGRGERHP